MPTGLPNSTSIFPSLGMMTSACSAFPRGICRPPSVAATRDSRSRCGLVEGWQVKADGPESDRVHLPSMTTETPACLPASIVPILWDVDPADVDVEADRAFLIGRVLSAGNLESMRWARRRYGDDAIRDWIVRHEGRQLSGPQIRFWETVIGLPADDVARWLAAPERTIWESRE